MLRPVTITHMLRQMMKVVKIHVKMEALAQVMQVVLMNVIVMDIMMVMIVKMISMNAPVTPTTTATLMRLAQTQLAATTVNAIPDLQATAPPRAQMWTNA